MRARGATAGGGKLVGGAAILAAGSIIAKIIGAFYRVPLTNILGAEGIGMYQLVFPVFALFTTLSTSGIPVALSRIVAEKRAEGRETKKYLVSALISLLAVSALAGILIASLSGVLARVQGNPTTASGYLVIAPAVFFVGVIAALRGWFQGEIYMVPTALSNVIEQLVKLGAGIGFAIAFADRGVVAAVCGALLGVTLSEAVAAVYLVVVYAVRSRKRPVRECLRLSRDEARGMFRVAFPFALLGVIMPLGTFLDSLIIVNALKWGGVATEAATAQYGLYSGPVASLVNAPVIAIMSLAMAVVPSVSLSRADRDLAAIITKSRMSIKLVYLVGVPAALFFVLFGRSILSVLYPALPAASISLAANLLSVQAFGVVLVGATQIYISLLQGLDKTMWAVKSLFAALVVKVVLSLVLVRYTGILGASAASIAMSTVSLILLGVSFRRLTDIHEEKSIAKVLLAGVIMALVGITVREYVPAGVAAIAAGAAVCAVAYIWLTTLFGVFSEEELRSLPFGGKLARFRRAVRFWD